MRVTCADHLMKRPIYILAVGARYETRFILKQKFDDPDLYSTVVAQESAGKEWFDLADFGIVIGLIEVHKSELKDFKSWKKLTKKELADLFIELL
jgi:hypothetical protein